MQAQRISQLLINPLSNPFAGPVALLLAVVFTGAGLALLLQSVLRRPTTSMVNGQSGQPETAKRSKMQMQKVLWQRYRTWAIIAPVFAGAALSGSLTLALLCAFLCYQGGREYALLTKMPATHLVTLILGSWLTLLSLLVWGAMALWIAPVVAFFGWSALAIQAQADEHDLSQRFSGMMIGLWGYMYLGWLPAHLLALGESKFSNLVLLVGIGVAMSDVGAFCTGRLIGGPKLAPRLSPNKTWGGVLGNLTGAGLALALIGFTLPSMEWWLRVALIVVIGVGSVWGDLLESLLKRQSGVKDAGGLLPGFGGLLDRIDSLLLVAPLVYYLTSIFL
jgi:phosphatidate cytidylyltransferase